LQAACYPPVGTPASFTQILPAGKNFHSSELDLCPYGFHPTRAAERRRRVTPSAEPRSHMARVPHGLFNSPIHRVYARPDQEGRFLAVAANVRDAHPESEVVPHFHVRRRTIEFKTRERCVASDGRQAMVDRALLVGDQPGNVGVAKCGEDCNKADASVLVGVVELVEPAETSHDEFLRTLVRLQSLDGCLCLTAERPDAPLSAVPPSGVLRDRECQTTLIGGRIDSAFLDRDRVDAVVEGASKAVNSVSEDEAPPNGGQRLVELDIEAVLTGVRIWLAPSSVGMAV
jgi:hypothetical protein